MVNPPEGAKRPPLGTRAEPSAAVTVWQKIQFGGTEQQKAGSAGEKDPVSGGLDRGRRTKCP
jgi:hypothetical protein